MFLIERLSNSIAIKVSKTLDLDAEKQEVLAYGAFSLLQTLWSVGLVMIFGYLFNVFWEATIISSSGALLRKYSGGGHATSPNRCAIIGVIMSVGPALILSSLPIVISIEYVYLYSIITLISSYYIIYKYSPVDSPNKPIVKEATKKRLKKASFNVIHILILVIVVLCIYYYRDQNNILKNIILSICTGVLWQDITLLPLGHNFITQIDTFLKNIFSLIGGEIA